MKKYGVKIIIFVVVLLVVFFVCSAFVNPSPNGFSLTARADKENMTVEQSINIDIVFSSQNLFMHKVGHSATFIKYWSAKEGENDESNFTADYNTLFLSPFAKIQENYTFAPKTAGSYTIHVLVAFSKGNRQYSYKQEIRILVTE